MKDYKLRDLHASHTLGFYYSGIKKDESHGKKLFMFIMNRCLLWKKCHDLRILENKLKIKKIYLEGVLKNSSSSKNEKTHKYMGPNATHLVLAPHQNAP